MTLAGLNTVNLSQLNTFQQCMLFLLILLGSAIWVSIAVVHIRRRAFKQKFKSIVKESDQRRRDRSSSKGRLTISKPISRSRPEVDGVVVRGRTIKSGEPSAGISEALRGGNEGAPANSSTGSVPDRLAGLDSRTEDHETRRPESEGAQSREPLSIDTGTTRRITFAIPSSPTRERHHGRIFSMQGVGARSNIQNHPFETPPPIYPEESKNQDEAESKPHYQHGFPLSGFTGRNSQFSGLSPAEREHLGGVEYRAVSILALLVPAYFILWQFLGCIGLGAYVAYNRAGAPQVNAENPWYDGV